MCGGFEWDAEPGQVRHLAATEAAFWDTYDKALEHAASCLACRTRRDEDGVSQGMCSAGDRLLRDHRRARRRARTEARRDAV
ncbi:hypothetical protein F9278_09560 [Streptomyces phaeolivaceus]|uniref:Uncharacterized protein n=1 Tax=Streptomyces phaeolivaceus TaxID=2653200 RepID=A0A5P8KHG7_9ACTN|nr:hypothetical protein F9278_09560 [Streptomyces phaeolivaceus]